MTLEELMNAPAPASAWVLAQDCQETGLNPEDIRAEMARRIGEMRASIERGLKSDAKSITGMVGWNAKGLWDAPDVLNAPLLRRVQAYAMAVNEENARMGRIVAAPTAGSAGTIPGALIGVADHLGIPDERLVDPLILAAGVGKAISKRMFISGAAGGCQAEIGSSAAMAAAAVTELLGGTPRACVHAASLALMNTIGLVCDPVGGYVEVPCVSRNAFYAVHAISAAQLALAQLESFIPPDEVLGAMASVGRMMPPELRETAEGGLAQTPTGLAVTARMEGKGDGELPGGMVELPMA
ncbi:L-serine ammonia-lyase, iron-sulfur-dependent, subunit alpha [Deinococcus metallilatus]|uniref:L-serine dehydratase n=1 Tax=Deinococcus metallilatus TaxID=1211322 RepID=A0AAJ5K471_9DEIO|nr:L-serine ammonia-lyase, iron-sulfur-dependent, subunit alpha [Deinococcus metallilatus]MBB5296599.1 L-serine dehydratase [Deinococcus metallilatus]QBY08380.1 L-serine ammonia-lyase, iron-sulfur-dependent, subunit alpha [Deinococcus metallilatus]RXJ11179.1 L-serine ammonia-lyase, iron-sulfur-dependent, subunit alpha [Deinococcus metallilatus]TLK24670.1 L-serine ammonia-lyase, iron-sulfur-dependent, subunit alpha [Deinococcus metallilatus]GMA17516.1 L-serine dehydratase, iron-sulfur-dependent